MAFNRTVDILGDLKLTADGRDIVMIDGAQKVVQSIRTRAQIFKGSWRYDLNLGVPYFQDILIGGPKTELVRRRFYELIAGTPGVISVQKVDILFGAKNQTVYVSFACTAADGTALTAKLDFLPSNAYAPIPPAFTPSSLSAVSAILDVASATLVAGDVSVLPDLLNSNPAQQSVAGRRPTMQLSANGLPCMRFATNDCLRWTLGAGNNSVQQWGIGLWVKPDSLASTQVLYSTEIVSGATGNKNLMLVNTAGVGELTAYTADAVSLIGQTPAGKIPALAWTFATAEWLYDAASNALKLTWSVNAVAQTVTFFGSVSTPAPLQTVTGASTIGNRTDGSATLPFNGLIGPQIYIFGSKMAGATTGLLTDGARLQLSNYLVPT